MSKQHDHGSGVQPAGDYAPGSRLVTPSGLSRGISSLPAEDFGPADLPAPPPVRRRPGRPMGSKNRPKD